MASADSLQLVLVDKENSGGSWKNISGKRSREGKGYKPGHMQLMLQCSAQYTTQQTWQSTGGTNTQTTVSKHFPEVGDSSRFNTDQCVQLARQPCVILRANLIPLSYQASHS